MPGLSSVLAQQYQPLNDAAMVQFGISNLNRAQHWLAQTGHESVSLRYLEEIADGSAYEGRPDLGNIYPGDGRRYKGRGPIQVTGRYNYTQAAAATGLDLVNNPQMASEPKYAFIISAWWWWNAGCNGIADGGPYAVEALTRRINGGLNGLADRQQRYNAIRPLGEVVLPTAPPTPPPSGRRRLRSMLEVPGGQRRIIPIPPASRIWLTAAGDPVWVNWNIGVSGNILHGDNDGRLTWTGWEIPWEWLDGSHTLYVENKVPEQPPVIITVSAR